MTNILEKVYQSSLNFLQPLNLDGTYKRIVSEATTLTGTEWGSIFLYENGGLKPAYSTLPKDLQSKPKKSGFIYKTFKTGKIHVISGKSINRRHALYNKAESVVYIPLVFDNTSKGVLYLISNERVRLNSDNFHSLKLFGTMASLAIRKAQLHQDMEAALNNRDIFISTASHELKTPLTSIYVYAQLLSQKFSNSHTPEGKWSKNLHREVKRLVRLVNELLDVDLVKSGALQYFVKKLSLKKVVKRAISDARLVYPDHNFITEYDEEKQKYYVNGDFDRLVQVVLNILSNATKFSPPQSLIKLNVSRKKPYVVLSVEDYGLGIEKEKLKKIFKIFYKADLRKEGMGMGLYLVKRIINRHHGEIKIVSEINKGTKVTIKLLEADGNI